MCKTNGSRCLFSFNSGIKLSSHSGELFLTLSEIQIFLLLNSFSVLSFNHFPNAYDFIEKI